MSANVLALFPAQTKRCSLCKEEKHISAFCKVSARKNGLNSRCRPCHNQYMTEYKKKHPDKAKRYRKQSNLKSMYNMEYNDYIAMLNAQNHRCAICNNLPTNERYPLNVDHCHETGKVRALLCGNCNLALGNFKENIGVLQSAIAYLRLHKGEAP